MALSGSRLQGTEQAGILAALQIAFPVNVSLLPAEQTAFNVAQAAFALALATGTASEIVSEITGHAVVTGVQTGGGTAVVT